VAFVDNKAVPSDLEERRDDIGWYWWFALTLGDPGNGRVAGTSAGIECMEMGRVRFPQMPSKHYGIGQLLTKAVMNAGNYLPSVVTRTNCPALRQIF